MSEKLTFMKMIDQIINALPGQDSTTVASLKAAAIFGAVEAARRMSESPESAAALCEELRLLDESKSSRAVYPVKQRAR